MDPAERRWWRLLDDLPAAMGPVQVWPTGGAPPDGDGQMHPTPTAVVCLAGVIRVERPGGGLDLGPGESLVIGSGVWHGHAPARPGSVFFAQGFLATCSDVILGDHRSRWVGRLPRDPSRRLIGEVVAEADAVRRRDRFAGLIRQVLAETVANVDFANPALRRMVRRMWEGMHRGVAVDDLLAASGLSRAQAYRVFTAGYGMPPKAALEAARLELAAALLAGGLGVGATAGRSGFAGTAAFSRAWRRRHGSAPTLARARVRPA